MKTQWTRTPENLVEFWHDFADLNRIVREWEDVGISVGASTNGWDSEGDNPRPANYRWGNFMVHGYDLKNFPDVPYRWNIRTKFPVEHSWFFELSRHLQAALLAEGKVMTTQDGMEISHQFHNGPGKVSFGVRMSDEDAYLAYLRGDFGPMKLRELNRAYDHNLDI